MSQIFFLLFLLANLYTSAICDTKCKEYLIIIKETSCPTNASLIKEPIKLHDLNLNHENCSEDSLKILSNNENSNKSYVIKIDYIGFESICVPIIKSTKLLEHIKIDDENITTNESEEFGKGRHEINKTMVTENNDTKTYPLECIIKNYKQTCHKGEAKETIKNEIRKTVNINLINFIEPASNITEMIFNYTKAPIIFEKCVLNDYLCTNSNTIDDYSENNDTLLQIILTSIGNKDTSVSSVMNNNIKNLNCTNIIHKHKNIKISHIKALTNSIITKYYCQDEDIDNRNFTVPKYDVSVYISIDLDILDTKLKYINCTGNFKPKNITGLNIDCNVNESVEKYINKDNFTTTSIENKHLHLSDRNNDSFNVYNKGINTTTKTPKMNNFGNEKDSKDKGKIRNDEKYLKINSTTETNPWREKAAVQRNQTDENDPLQEMYYVSPRVLTTAIVALLAAVGSVLTYALCLFRKKEQAYQATPTRDWSEMDATEF